MSEITAVNTQAIAADSAASQYVAPKSVTPQMGSENSSAARDNANFEITQKDGGDEPSTATASDAENFLSNPRLELLLWLMNLEMRLPPYGAK